MTLQSRRLEQFVLASQSIHTRGSSDRPEDMLTLASEGNRASLSGLLERLPNGSARPFLGT